MPHRASLRGRFVSVAALGALGLLLGAAPAAAAITLAGDAATAFETTVVAESLSQPTDVAVLPDGKVLVITRLGDVLVYSEPNGEPTEAHVDIRANPPAEQGLLGVVLDPNFATNQFVYFYASMGDDVENRHHVLRYKLDADGVLSDETVVINMGLRGPANHNGGALDIHAGNLYIGVGDTGANNTPPTNKFSTCLNIANGKVLRVSLAEATLGQPAEGNPLMGEDMVTGCDSTGGELGMRAPEKRIYAWGFRNPFRLWVDPTNGKLWVGDVGETTREEVSVGDSGHYGYPFFEGTTEYDQDFKPEGACSGITPGVECTPPAYDWDRGGAGTAIGGRILDGCGWPDAWKNRYIFGDYEQGEIKTIEVNSTRDGAMEDSVADFASANGLGAFRMGTDNALYIVEVDGGAVTRVNPTGMAPAANSCPNVNDAPGEDPGGGGGGAGGGANAGSSPGGNSPGGNATGGNATGGNASGGTQGNPTAGTQNGTAGSNNGTAGTGSGGSSDSGCGCRAVGQPGSLALGLGALVGALGLFQLRRRSVRRSCD